MKNLSLMQYTLHRCLLLFNTDRVDNISFHTSHNLKTLDCVCNPTTDDRNRPIIYFLLSQTERCHKQQNNKQTNQFQSLWTKVQPNRKSKQASR